MTTSTETTSYKSNIPELSIIIHYRKDSDDREKNLRTLLRFLSTNFITKDIIVVNDERNFNGKNPKWIQEYATLFCIENDDEFKKSFCFNYGALAATGEVLCFWDVDVLIDPEAITEAYDDIFSRKEFDHVYPFNGTFVDVKREEIEKFIVDSTVDFSGLFEAWKSGNTSYEFASGESPGGCNLISRKAFSRIEGYDHRFIGWGFEDTDFLNRSRRVNRLKYFNDNSVCWHTHHENAIRTENPHYNNNIRIYNENQYKRYR